jgi:lipoprotein-anchoring transpeptidase ErfK/SrfK
MRIPIHLLRTVGAAIAVAGAILSINPASAQVMSYSPSYAPRFPANMFQPLAPQAYAYAPARQQTYQSMRQQAYQSIMPEPDQSAAAVPLHLRRQVVNYPTREAPGTIIVDTPNTYLYYVLGGGQALRYGIGVGREGFTWSGVRAIDRKAEWPDWVPPPEMVQRQPYLPRFMAGGEGNPLGARALYIGGTTYRIHGTNAPSSIGQNATSGCIRMLNEDVIDLYERVKLGTKVVVLPGAPRSAPTIASHQPRMLQPTLTTSRGSEVY